MKETLGFIGLGAMGLPMARNLLRAGHGVAVHDLAAEAVAVLVGEGAVAAPSPAAVAAQSEIVLTCLPSGEAVEAVLTGKDGLLEQPRQGQVLIDTSTDYPPHSLELSKKLAAAGLAMLDAPVSGGPEGAAEGGLSIMVGGDPQTYQRCLPILKVLGKQITHMGAEVGAGGYAKLTNQIMVYLNLASVVEALAYAERVGLDAERLLPALRAGHADSVLLKNKGGKIARRDWSPEGPVWMSYKDLSYVVRSTEEMGFTLPFIPQLRDMMKELVEQGKEGLDQAALFELFQSKYTRK